MKNKILISEKDCEIFFKEIEKPSKPNKYLIESMKKHRLKHNKNENNK